jgi:cobalt/nickel transport system permease protein
MKYRRAWIVLLLCALLTPLGIIAAGGAWGEWALKEIEKRVGFIPEGMRGASERSLEAPLADYSVPGLNGGIARRGLGTAIAAVLGGLITALAAAALVKVTKHVRIP